MQELGFQVSCTLCDRPHFRHFFRNISFEPFNLSTLQGEQFRAVVHQLHQREAAAALQPHGNQPVRP